MLAQRAWNLAAYSEMADAVAEAAEDASWQVHSYRGDATDQAAIRHEKARLYVCT